MYKIFLDKSKIFECDIDIEGATLSESEVRLHLETGNYALVFNGDISSSGSVKIPIGKLKGVLEEDFTGKIFLEVIADDTRFTPWESQYHTDISKKVKVASISESEFIEEFKPKITFKLKEEKEEPKEKVEKKINVKKYLFEIEGILDRNKIKYKVLYNNLSIFDELMETYFKENHINSMDLREQIKKDMFEIIKP